tara:strand:- start:211 stop:732 length:522 start_codon:yes stop_codon:yes gene_type:complete
MPDAAPRPPNKIVTQAEVRRPGAPPPECKDCEHPPSYSADPGYQQPRILTRDDAIVVSDSDRMAAEAASWWYSLATFYQAPCLQNSVFAGTVGGFGMGALRFFSTRDGRTALTLGASVAGLLAGTNWFVCRRAMYMGIKEESNVLNRAVAGDPEAVKEYSKRMQERERRKAGS